MTDHEEWHKALGICSILLGLISLITIIGGFVELGSTTPGSSAPSWFIALSWVALPSVVLAGAISGFWHRVDQLSGVAEMFVRGVGVLGILMTLTIFGYAVVLVLIIIGLVAIVFIALVD